MAATYISWSRELGELCADEFTTTLSRVFDEQVRVLYSAQSIPPGVDWFQANQHALSTCDSAVILVTKAGLSSPWLFFESGYLQNRKNVISEIVLIGVEPIDTRGTPFSHLQCKSNKPSDLCSLFKRIQLNATVNDKDIINPILDETKNLSELLSRLAEADASTTSYKDKTIESDRDPYLYDACFSLIKARYKDDQIARFFDKYGIAFDEYSNHIVAIRG